VDECFEGWIHHGGHCFPRVKFLEGEDVSLDEDANGVCNDLLLRIQKFPNALDFLALLDTVEEHFEQVSGCHWAPEQGVISE
jgi:hypothetical protein